MTAKQCTKAPRTMPQTSGALWFSVWRIRRTSVLLKKYLFTCLHQALVAAHRSFCLHCSRRTLSCGLWDLVPWPGIEPRPPALGAHSLSHWTTRKVPGMSVLWKQIWWGSKLPQTLQSPVWIFSFNISWKVFVQHYWINVKLEKNCNNAMSHPPTPPHPPSSIQGHAVYMWKRIQILKILIQGPKKPNSGKQSSISKKLE